MYSRLVLLSLKLSWLYYKLSIFERISAQACEGLHQFLDKVMSHPARAGGQMRNRLRVQTADGAVQK
ncbi:hypothetical protein PGTUg99_014062 [Puccinia graminis f. sp. tritici]|uniref:Uncharacterized protein n=1 Tax=Puccinia graminis f. sp. tritici TaxID=56615 RepID=A0A5B0QGX2_PUCGR|nr:hypothetical protein PGTUg99_014062 [Puccinia graminis f. sp. tritici]